METEGLRKELRYILGTDRQMPPEASVSVRGQGLEEKKTHGNLTKKGGSDRTNQKVDTVEEAAGPLGPTPQVHYLTISYLLM